MKDEEYTYEKAGVSVDKATQAHKLIGQLIERTCSFRDGKFGAVVGEYGHYAGLLDIGNNLQGRQALPPCRLNRLHAWRLSQSLQYHTLP